MVEFALAISVFMLLILGTFDLARAYLAYTVVTNSVREVGRYAAAHIADTSPAYQASDAVQAGMNLAVGVDTSQLKLTAPTSAVVDPSSGLAYVTASGTYAFQSLTPWVSVLLNPPAGKPISLSASTTVLGG